MDTPQIVLCLIFGVFGLTYFVYGKKRSNLIMRYSGLALMVFPYFISNNFVVLGVGVGLLAAPAVYKRYFE